MNMESELLLVGNAHKWYAVWIGLAYVLIDQVLNIFSSHNYKVGNYRNILTSVIKTC